LAFVAFWVEGDAVHWANLLALRLVVVAHALGAQVRVDDIDLLAWGDRIIGAFGLADVAINALVGNHQGHGHTSQMAFTLGLL
tara:strand:+ start:6040 stop:6288 length:249 start_codon:yes stop_codon:yes gene_type:complete